MSKERIVAVVNPKASNGAGGKRWPKLEKALREHWPELEVQMTERQGHASALTAEALERGADMVIAVGGDGTTNEVLGGFLDAEGRNRFPDACLGVIANGTGGDFQRMFGALAPLAQVQRLAAANIRTVDYGLVRFVDHEGEARTRAFVNMVSVGISGLVDAIVNDSGRPLGSTAAYVGASLEAISKWRNQPVTLRYDDGDAQELDLTLLCLGNGQYFGAGMHACPNAEVDSGQLEAVLLDGFRRRHIVGALGRCFKGKHIGYRGIESKTVSKVQIDPREGAEVLIDLDGEQPGKAPLSVEVVHAGLRLRIA